MPQPAGPLVSELLQRIRDPQGMATSRAVVFDILSRCQQIVNAAVQSTIQTATINTTANKLIYSITTFLPAAIRIIGVRNAVGQDVSPLPSWTVLAELSRTWFRDMGDEYLAWALIGRDQLVLWPTLTYASTVTVQYVALTATLAVDSDQTQISDQDVPIVLDLAEAVLLLKTRDFAGVAAALERVKARVPVQASLEQKYDGPG